MNGAIRDSADLARHYRDSGFFVARTPLLPWSVLTNWAGPGLVSDPSEPLYQAQRARQVEALRRLFARSDVAEATFFTSSRLAKTVAAWVGGESRSALELTLSRYLLRMAGRATPFGVFAGVSLGEVAGETRLELGASDGYRRHTRLGMEYLECTLSDASAREDVRRVSTFVLNSTLYHCFGRYRFTLARAGDLTSPLLDVEATPELARALARAEGGASLEQLTAAISDGAVSAADALDLARELVQQGLVVPGWLPPVTGPEPCAALAHSTLGLPPLQPLAARLADASRRLADADQSSIGLQLDGLRALAEELEADAPAIQSHVLQADLIKPAPDLCLSRSVARRCLRAAELIQRTGSPAIDPRLEAFRRRFVARYEARLVPLVEVLDQDLGIGFDQLQQRGADELLHELGLRRAVEPALAVEPTDVRLRILTRALRRGGIEYDLDAGTLAWFPERAPTELPESFAVTAQLALEAGEPAIIAPALTGPSGIALLARFGHADEGLRHAIEAHAAAEQACAGDRLLVDVAYLPGGQAGNVLLRPVLRSAEIPYGGRSGAGAAAEIPISDVYVTVVGERIELYSQARRCRLSIRITNAHRFDGWWNLPVYRFLGALQDAEGRLVEGWSWGSLEVSPFLPRIVCEGIVLSRARWRLATDELAHIVQTNGREAFAAVQLLRAELGLPRWVALQTDGTPLPIDLDNVLAVEVLLDAVRRGPTLELHEVLPTPEKLIMSGPEGRFASEIIVPFVARAPLPAVMRWPPSAQLTPMRRTFPPGSDWLYAKIYVGASQLDSVVQMVAKQVIPELVARGAALWFYVPYADPELHVRLRLLCPSASVRQAALARLAGVLEEQLANAVVSRLQLDTYEREIERYGGLAGVELSEELFCFDSQACVGLLALCADEPTLRWQLTLAGIDRLYDDFGLNLDGRLELAEQTLHGLREGFTVTSVTLQRIGRKYRRYAARVGMLVGGDAAVADAEIATVLGEARRIWDQRSAAVVGLRPRLGHALQQRETGIEMPSLIASFAHMHAVRMLGVSARPYELVMHDFLRRTYMTRRALTSSRQRRREEAS